MPRRGKPANQENRGSSTRVHFIGAHELLETAIKELAAYQERHQLVVGMKHEELRRLAVVNCGLPLVVKYAQALGVTLRLEIEST